MDAVEFANLQEALMWALGPAFLWLTVLMLATSILGCVTTVALILGRRMTRRRL